MFTVSQGLAADFAPGSRRGKDRKVEAPASDFWHDGRLNMGPAIWLIVALSLLAWAGVIGAAALLRQLI